MFSGSSLWPRVMGFSLSGCSAMVSARNFQKSMLTLRRLFFASASRIRVS